MIFAHGGVEESPGVAVTARSPPLPCCFDMDISSIDIHKNQVLELDVSVGDVGGLAGAQVALCPIDRCVGLLSRGRVNKPISVIPLRADMPNESKQMNFLRIANGGFGNE